MTDTTTRTKTVETIRHYPPQEIREQTKVRRAWIEAKIVEIKAQPLRDAKSVQSGSYQHVVEYVLAEVAARVQIRGTCQFCCNQQAIENGRLVLHGYTRPGDGYTLGRCAGVALKPAEVSIDDAKHFVTSLRTQEVEERKTLETLRAEMKALDEFQYGGEEYPKVQTWHLRRSSRTSFEKAKPRDQWTAAEVRAVKFEQKKELVKALAGQAETIETHVFPKFGGELVKVLV